MQIITTIKDFISWRTTQTKKIGFVPTMGALHEGHLSLIQKSKSENDSTVVSIFVNPTQFLPNEDFSKYPRKEKADIRICELANVDVLFMPTAEEMYFEDEPTICSPSKTGYILEGYSRPGHFDGVLRIVLKLLSISSPTNAYFGKKDAQQLFLISNMVKTLFLKTNIIGCDIIRDKEGLALSSRNTYLTPEEYKLALSIPEALKVVSWSIMKGQRDISVIEGLMKEELSKLHVEYACVLSREFKKIPSILIGETLILIAAKVGTTRLIDNLWI